MRKIKFRGKRADNIEWIYGNFLSDIDERAYIIPYQLEWKQGTITNIYEVFSKTVGQYTGVEDKDGDEIYEGDILKFDKHIGIITYEKGSYFFKEIKPYVDFDQYEIALYDLWVENVYIEKIGNIYENKDLI